MRNWMRNLIGTAMLAGLAAVPASATVWWPEVAPVSPKLTVYRDYDDPNLFYYVPKGVAIARTDEGAPMINHGLFFDRLHPAQSSTQYHLTLEPILGGAAIDEALAELRRRYGASAALVPLPITTVSFDVTQVLAGANQLSSAFSVAVPTWTGDLHSFHQRFSVAMKGNAYSAEPAMSRFMVNPAGNAFVGTMHYGFRGANMPLKGHAVVNVHQFVSKMRANLSASYGFWASADIAYAADKLKDDQSVFVEVVRDEGYENQFWKSLLEKLIATVFEPMPVAPETPAPSGGGLFFKISASYASVEKDKKITIDFKETLIKNHSGDIDIAAGGVPESLLDPNIKYLCDMWARYDRAAGKCVAVCEEGIEYYNPRTRGCEPAFGAANE